ncbi:MAG: thiamine diphosphokinase [Treponema sp.]|nr:thiamine diphosphokinase [Treponema sp.]
MLGIIFTGGEGPQAQIAKRLTEIRTEDALFFAADSGFDAAQRAGIKPNLIVGDMDSLKAISSLDSCQVQNIIRYPHDKDFTDTELAFSAAVEKGCERIWIIGGGGGRIDHLFGIRSMFERDIFPLRWITSAEDIHCIAESTGEMGYKQESALCCNLEIGACVSVFPLGDGPWEAESSGLKWPLAGLSWNRGFFGLSNVAVDGKISITAIKGRFMVILPLTT